MERLLWRSATSRGARWLQAVIAVLVLSTAALAEEPTVSYIFPAGGQRGTVVDFKVGGHFLHGECDFEMLGPGIEAGQRIRETETLWFEGPVIPQPASQRKEDYPRDHAGRVSIAADARLGTRPWRVWTSQGATASRQFVVGDLPEIVEAEIDGDPIPVSVKLPVTINGRIFPREDVDIWTIDLEAGQTIHCEVCASRIGSPLDSRLEVLDPVGHRIAENGDHFGTDSFVRFTTAAAGTYQVRIHDINFGGLQDYVYRLSLTTGPHIDAVYPLGGRRGSSLQLELVGHEVPSQPSVVSLSMDGDETFYHQVELPGGKTQQVLLDLDELPEHLETEPNHLAEQAAIASPPCMLNGRILQPGDTDVWAVPLMKGDAWELDLRAARLDSPLDSVLTVTDEAGKQLARSEDLAGGQTDSRLPFKAPADGVYYVRVQDQFPTRGGADFAYRLRIDKPAEPGFELTLPVDALTLFRESQVKLKLDATRLGGFQDEIKLKFDNLPAGVSVSPNTIPAKKTNVQLVFQAEKTAAVQAVRLKIVGVGTIEDKTIRRLAQRPVNRGSVEMDHLLLGVAMPAPFKVVGVYSSQYAPRGSVHRRRYTIERSDYDGPLTVRLADRQARHLQGVTGPEIIVPAGASEFEYPAFLAPQLVIGRTSRTCLMAEAEVTDADGSKHRVSYSSTNQNEQIVILTDPGLLSVSAGRSSLAAEPGKTVMLPIRVERSRSVALPVKVELIVPAHIEGVSASPVHLPADTDQATLSLHFGARPGPFNMPLVVQATAMDGDEPIVGETAIEVVPRRLY